jgi:hypothetical protein
MTLVSVIDEIKSGCPRFAGLARPDRVLTSVASIS